MLFKKFAFIALLISIFSVAGCGSNDPVVNYNNSPIVAKSGNKNLKDVKRAIVLAGSRLGWQMQSIQPGIIQATLFSQGHMAKVEISYSTESYSINYKDSSNLKYNGQTIHGTYNKWVEKLHGAIRTNLARI
ncbi:MAG: hypothetical protein PVF28_05395 [Thioalkalispiraceae bacterium]|jgi:hypothetical protein